MAGNTAIEEIKSRLKIAEIFTACFPDRQMVRRGNRWWACCPFHAEKHASFCLDIAKQRFT